MSGFETENPAGDYLSVSETAYTHFRPINASIRPANVELTSTIDDVQEVQDDDDKESPSKKARFLRCCEVFVLLVLIIVVWLVLALPTVFFYLPKNNGNNKAPANTTNHSTNCTPVEYTGSICTSHLKSYQDCLPESSISDPHVYIPNYVDQEMNENKLSLIESISPKCKAALLPLACLYYFRLCETHTNKVITLTVEQCDGLKEGACKQEWQLAIQYGFTDKLPRCDSIDIHTDPPPTSNCSHTPTKTIKPIHLLTCRDDFQFNSSTGRCEAVCGKWTPYSDVERHTSDVFVILAASCAIVSGSVVLVLSCVRCKKVFRYPSIFIVYQTIPTILLGALVLVAYVDREGFFCSSMDIWESYRHPTTFCTISGICLYYVMMQLLLLWFFHVITMFWGVHWPIHASALLSSKKRIMFHILAVCLALALPAIPVCVIYKLSPGGFTITRLPPILCAGTDLKFNFYTFVLPISVIIACGLTLMILIFWSLLKKRIMHHIRHTRMDANWGMQVRVLTVLCYFVVLGIVVLTTITASMINFELFKDKLRAYFMCETTGIPINSNSTSLTSDCGREGVVSLVNPITTTVAFIILGFYPAVNLVFVIHVKELRDNCFCCRPTREVEYTYRESRPYSFYNGQQFGGSTAAVRSRGIKPETNSLY